MNPHQKQDGLATRNVLLNKGIGWLAASHLYLAFAIML